MFPLQVPGLHRQPHGLSGAARVCGRVARPGHEVRHYPRLGLDFPPLYWNPVLGTVHVTSARTLYWLRN